MTHVTSKGSLLMYRAEMVSPEVRNPSRLFYQTCLSWEIWKKLQGLDYDSVAKYVACKSPRLDFLSMFDYPEKSHAVNALIIHNLYINCEIWIFHIFSESKCFFKYSVLIFLLILICLSLCLKFHKLKTWTQFLGYIQYYANINGWFNI